MTYIFLIIWLGYLSAEAGASLPWSKTWQDLKSWGSEVPEVLIGLTIGLVATFGYCTLLGINPLWALLMFPLPSIVTYIGQQSGTWAYLNWTGGPDRDKDRKSMLRPTNDFLAGLLGFKYGDEGYSWVWAATKGFIITLPIGGIGAILFPLGHELGSHAKGRLPGDPNMWKELTSGWGLGLACVIYLLLLLVGTV